MISLRKPICLKKPPKPQLSAANTGAYPKLSLVKPPKPSHPVEGFHHFIRTLARELARSDHAAQA